MVESATYLHGALNHLFGPAVVVQPTPQAQRLPPGPGRSIAGTTKPTPRVDPSAQRALAVAAGYRFDDAFRAYRSESRTHEVSLTDVTHLVTAAAYLTLTADAIEHLWSALPQSHHATVAHRPLVPQAAEELLGQVLMLTTCYLQIGRALAGRSGALVPEQQPRVIDLPRLAEEVLRDRGTETTAAAGRHALAGPPVVETATSVHDDDHAEDVRVALAATRAAWTADLLHALWDLQAEVVRVGRAVGGAQPPPVVTATASHDVVIWTLRSFYRTACGCADSGRRPPAHEESAWHAY